MTSALFKKTYLASECVSNQNGVADSQGLGKQEKTQKKVKNFVTKYPIASINVLTSGYNLQ